MNKPVGLMLAVCVSIVLAAGTALAVDGTVKASAAFTAAGTWNDGIIAEGAGSTMTVTGAYTVSDMYTNTAVRFKTPANRADCR